MRIRRIRHVRTKWPAAARNLIPLSRFPQGQAGAGMVPPTRRTLRASQTRWHASMQPLPPQEEFQTAPLNPPLRDPPEGLSRCTVPRWRGGVTIIARQKRIRKGRHVGLDFYDLLIEDDKDT
jgi:hypothetical protein